MDSFKYLGIDIPCNYAWGQCAYNGIDIGHAKYYQFESMCTQKSIKRWEIKAIIFETCVVQAILSEWKYGEQAFQTTHGMRLKKYKRRFYVDIGSQEDNAVLNATLGNR